MWPLTDRADHVFAAGNALRLGDPEGTMPDDAPTVVVAGMRWFKRGVLVQFEGVADRDAAEALAGRYLLAPRTTLSAPATGEVYYHDLLGLTVVTVAGDEIGRVREVFEARPVDLLEVENDDGHRRLMPLSQPIVQEIDVVGGRIVIDPPPGLLDL